MKNREAFSLIHPNLNSKQTSPFFDTSFKQQTNKPYKPIKI